VPASPMARPSQDRGSAGCAIAGAVLERPVNLVPECERWIVWPLPLKSETEPRETELGAQGIRVFTYKESGERFRLRGWSAPPAPSPSP